MLYVNVCYIYVIYVIYKSPDKESYVKIFPLLSRCNSDVTHVCNPTILETFRLVCTRNFQNTNASQVCVSKGKTFYVRTRRMIPNEKVYS